jgi:hypothetical protein
LGQIPNGEYLEQEYQILHNKFYKYASRQQQLSDLFIDASARMLKEQNKKFVFFSWERRNCKSNVLYPLISSEYRQHDTPLWETNGHLTEQGMQHLANIIMEKL